MNIGLDGNNFFHTGWLACLVGLPNKHPSWKMLRPEENSAFADGWKMCEETVTSHDIVAMSLYPMIIAGQACSFWQDDEGNEIEVPE